MDDDVCYRESIIRIEINDADIPANCGCGDDDVLADIQNAGSEIERDRFGKLSSQGNDINWKQDRLYNRRY